MVAGAVIEQFGGRVGPRWRRAVIGAADLALTADGLRLSLEGAVAGALSVAQLDEGQRLAGGGGAWRLPLRLTVRARWSHPVAELLGTSGFGFWNDPGGPGGFTAAPAWVWIAHYSPPSHVALDERGPGHGLLGAVLAAPSVGRLGLAVGNLALRLPGLARLATAAARRVVPGGQLPLTVDPCAWHDYDLTWAPAGVTIAVDRQVVGHLAASPAGPLGFVAWMDNQWAALQPDGAARGGYLAVPVAQWLEIGRLAITPRPAG
jgi:hypothetical protein